MFSVVVGASRGVGAAVSAALEARGDEVARLSRGTTGFDLTDDATWEPLLARVRKLPAGWTSLVFCQRYRQDPSWEREVAVAVGGMQKLVDRLLPHASRDGAAIVVVNSPAARTIASEQSVQYHMAKAALEQWARYMAVELGPKGIRVNGVTPGRIGRENASEQLAEATPLRRLADDRDVAEVVLFLSSPASRAVTGQEIFVDGGLSLLAPANLVQRKPHQGEST